MTQEFVYNTPTLQFISENEVLEETKEKVETFFEGNNGLEHFRTIIQDRSTDNEDGFETFHTPLKTEVLEIDENPRRHMRRSISMCNLPVFPQDVKEDLDEIQYAMNNLQKCSSSKVQSSQTTHNIVKPSSSKLRAHSVSRDHLDQLAKPKKYNSTENLRLQNRYISFAEAINKFHNGTPTRFRSKPAKEGPVLPKIDHIPTTIPQSPKFATKGRKRAPQILSSKELEQKELEEMKNFQVKAHPVNKKILQAPSRPLVPIVSKSVTVQEPFKLTVPVKRFVSPKKETVEFHARPIPKSVFEPPKPIIKESKITQAFTPKFLQRLKAKEKKPQPMKALPLAQAEVKLTRTMPQPFSFETRDKLIQKHKEELLNKVLEEEKKLREFHAKPPPKYIFKSPRSAKQSNDSLSSIKSEDGDKVTFKAKSADVLKKKPFIPVKPGRTLVEITEIHLNTDKRAKEREEYDQKLKKHEESMMNAKKQREEELLRLQEEEIGRLRKESVHKAQPVRRFKKFVVQPSSQPVTEPISPKFQTDVIRNKENRQS